MYNLKNKNKNIGKTNGLKKVINLDQNYITLVPIKCMTVASS